MKVIPGSTGFLIPGVEGRLLREDGSPAGPNEPGELWIRGKTIALGYWNNEKANKETFVNGWLKTGDIFSVNEHGSFLCVAYNHLFLLYFNLKPPRFFDWQFRGSR